jgi:hypothetical protein
MPQQEYVLSGYRGMWLFAMFDLPVTTRKARKRYTQFRKLLIERFPASHSRLPPSSANYRPDAIDTPRGCSGVW